jgi:ribosome-binding factor A
LKSSKSKKSRGRSSPGSGRGFRVADQIQKDIAQLLRLELKDPRVGFVTVTEVEVSSDLSHAWVYYSVLPDTPEQKERTDQGLSNAKGFLRTRLGKLLGLYSAPELHFVFDDSIAQGAHLSRLIDLANQGQDSGSVPTDSDKP